MSLRHAVLGALSVRPSSGYELVTRFNTSLRYVWFASQGAIYAEVNRLEADGLVAPSETGPRGRTTYTVTDAGLGELRSWLLASPKREPRSEFVLRTFSLYQPRRQVVFAEGRWIRGEQAAVACFYLLALLAVVGAVALRRRGVPLLVLLAPLAVTLLSVVIGYGHPRLRHVFEPSLMLLGAAGALALLERWRERSLARGGAGGERRVAVAGHPRE